MSGASVEFDSRSVERLLNGIGGRLGDMTPAFDAVGEVLQAQVADAFEQQTAPDGTPWPKSERAHGKGGQTLVDTGRLRSSITRNATADSVEVGTNVVYALVHQLGADFTIMSTRRHVWIIARPYLPDDETVDWPEIVGTVEDYLAGGAA